MAAVWGTDAHILQTLDAASKHLIRSKPNRAPTIVRVIKTIAAPSACALLMVCSGSPSSAQDKPLSQQESFAFGVGFTSGIVTTTCMLEDADLLSTDEARLFMQGVLESIVEKETGSRLEASKEGYAVAKRKFPDCPIP